MVGMITLKTWGVGGGDYIENLEEWGYDFIEIWEEGMIMLKIRGGGMITLKTLGGMITLRIWGEGYENIENMGYRQLFDRLQGFWYVFFSMWSKVLLAARTM